MTTKSEVLNPPRGKPRGIFTGRIKKAISSSLTNPAASGEECARYRGSRISNEFLWAALDCPSGFAVLPVAEGMTIVLGQLSGHIYGNVRASEVCVVIGWPIQIEGRKRVSGSVVFSEAGDVVAIGRATWIEVPESAFPAEKSG